jgi:hypothetical protein
VPAYKHSLTNIGSDFLRLPSEYIDFYQTPEAGKYRVLAAALGRFNERDFSKSQVTIKSLESMSIASIGRRLSLLGEASVRRSFEKSAMSAQAGAMNRWIMTFRTHLLSVGGGLIKGSDESGSG